MPITVSIVEDDDGVREGLVRHLLQSPGFCCLTSHASAEAALEAIPSVRPDVLLMDIHLPGMDGIECVRRLHLLQPALRIVMLTVYEDPDQIFDALTAGAIGYLLKQTPVADLLDAIRDAHQGGAPMSSQIARKVVQFFRARVPAGEVEELSTREAEVLNLLAKGYLIKEIAGHLGIGFVTVSTHIRRIYKKMHVHSRSQAVARYLQSPTPLQ